MITILLLGKTGTVSWELRRSLSCIGRLAILDRNSSKCGDLAFPERLASTIRLIRPDVIVNAAAFTDVDKAESEFDLAQTINAVAPEALAQVALEIDALLVHYSTDYVFDGTGVRYWLENDTTFPLNLYGRTKLDGELAIRASGCKYLIFRTSWVYGVRGNNFAKMILRMALERECLKVIDDQHGAPTGADLIADVTAHAIRGALLNSGLCDLYHLVAAGETTWHRYASYVIARARELRPDILWKVREVAQVSTSAFPTPAKRPLNSRMNTQKIQQTFGLSLPHWTQGVNRFLEAITDQAKI